MQRRVVLVSGAELFGALKIKGHQVSAKIAFSPRVAAIVERLPVGSYVFVLTPALDAHDQDVANPYPAASGLRDVFDISADSLTIIPRATVSLAQLGAVPPAVRQHYTPDAADPTLMHYKPSTRTRSTEDPLGRLVICMWRGVGKHSIMVPQKDLAWLEALFMSLPAYAHFQVAAAAAAAAVAATVDSTATAAVDSSNTAAVAATIIASSTVAAETEMSPSLS